MTAIAVRVSAEPRTSAAEVLRMLGAMRARGNADEVAAVEGTALGAADFSWETQWPRIGRHGPFTVVADATLYYRDDLRRALGARGVETAGGSAGELIAAAYAAFGDECVRHLEGDFAFVVWDQQRNRLFGARDFVGKRTLFYRAASDALTVASTIGGVIAEPSVPRDLNVAYIAATAAGLWSHAPDTCYRGVFELAAGHTLTWHAGAGVAVSRFWNPPAELNQVRESADDASRHLLELLTSATDERLAPDGATAVTLSGGWDSTAVYGAGQHALGARPDARAIQAVSISYPEGDTGREDEFIAETTTFWNARPAWIAVDDIAVFGDANAAARQRDEPFAHPYEAWNRALARTARASGARVMLDGSGGDQLFQTSHVFLADLFAGGEWVELVRQWRMRDVRGPRAFYHAAIRPRLPDSALRWIARLRGSTAPRHYLDRAPSAWCRHAFLREHHVLERELAARPALPRASTVLAETHAFLLYPYFARVTGRVAGFATSEGVESRSPLLDARVVDFAARRPWHERTNGRETKILLRRAMHGLLPERLLAPRAFRTGTTSGYFKRSLQGPGRAVIEKLLRDPRLADMGIVDPKMLARAWEYYLRTGDEDAGLRVFFTAQTELWLRERA